MNIFHILSILTNVIITALLLQILLKYTCFILRLTICQFKSYGVVISRDVLGILLFGMLINMFRYPYLFIKIFFLRFVFKMK